MKHLKKMVSIVLVLAMVFSLALTASAQTVDSEDGGAATITVKNAAKGENYSVVKIFDASVTGADDGSIAYTGDIPTALSTVFTKDAAGNIKVADGVGDEDVIAAVTEWAKTQTATAFAESDGSELTFTNLQYGYYAVITTQGSVVTVDSTNPNATVVDKNLKEPGIEKAVDDADVDIDQTVTYTATATTANFIDHDQNAATDSQRVVQYEIADTLPEFLKDVEITGITIDGTDYIVDGKVPQFAQLDDDTDLEIIIPWVDANGNSLYKNGAAIVVTYTATVDTDATIDGAGNKNIVTLQPYVDADDDDEPEPSSKTYKDDEIIFTYAAALQKVDENKKPLAGAKFAALGLTVEKVSDGVYRVVSYDLESTEYGTEMETDSEGQLVILGLSTESVLTVKETEAPAGYNKLVNTTTMKPVTTGEEIKATETTIYYDADGKVTDQMTAVSYTKTTYNVSLLKTAIVVVNEKGVELPSTGGMGTTIFYIVGGVLAVAAVVLLITKKRMGASR